MDIYIDKPNLLSIVHSYKNEQYADCIRMLKDNFRIIFTFDKDEIKNMESNDKQDVMQWMSQLSTGLKADYPENPKWKNKFPSSPFDISKFENDKTSTREEKLSAVYCLSRENDQKIEEHARKGNLMIAVEGQEINVISSLFFDSLQYTKNIFQKITSWDKISKYTSPCTDVIICDQFLFSSPELYQNNIYSLIRALCANVKDTRVNIIIFTLKSNYDKNNKIDFEPDWNTIYTKIRKCAEKHSSFNVTFVTASKNTLEEHDRTIFTNYKCFASGDSYNYFNNSGEKITNGRYLHVHSNADLDNKIDAEEFLKDMQDIINNIRELNNPSLIKKDKISNFLNFF